MKYHKKLKRTDLLKYNWKQLLMMAASEFSRADSLFKNGQGRELDNCLLRAKELLGVLEIDPSIPQAPAIELQTMTKQMTSLNAAASKTLYSKAMALAS